jgi:hypothetical protein
MAEGSTVIADHLEARERARTVDRVKITLYLLAAVGAVLLAGTLIKPLQAERSDLQIQFNPDIFRQVPPDIAMLSTTLGPLRGLWIYALWIQADKLKEERRFYDALQRAQWICKLQPRFPEVWEFQSWNMAYNISVTRHTSEERWQWVRNALMLLMQQGIPLNPYSERLYKQTAWIFFHKLGDVQDDMHWVYKKQWAMEMERLFGPPEYGLTGEQIIDRFRDIAEAPPSVAVLRRQNHDVAVLLDALADLGFTPDQEFLSAYHDALIRKTAVYIASRPDSVMSEQDAALLELMGAEPNRKSADALLACVRRSVLTDVYHMDPEWMLSLMERYGPLDWRVVYAHTLYWATKGGQMRRAPLSDPSTEMQRDRIILFGLKGMFAAGRIMFTPDLDNPANSFFAQFTDVRYAEPLHEEYVRYGHKHDPRAAEGTGGYYMATGHVNAVHEAIRTLFVRGSAFPEDMARAQKLYKYLRDHYRQPDGSPKPEYLNTLADWVEIDMRGMAERSRTSRELLSSFFDAELLALSLGKYREAEAYLNWAKRVYDIYMRDKADSPTDRMAMYPFDELHRQAIARFFIYAQVPIPYKTRVWDLLSLELRRSVYDLSIPALQAQCQAAGYDLAKAFPEPPDMEAYRKAHPELDKKLYIPEPEPVDPNAPPLEYEIIHPD